MIISNRLDRLIKLIQNGHSTYGIATSIMLAWIMRVDDNTNEVEAQILDDYLKQFNLLGYKSTITDIIDLRDNDCIEFAAEILKRELTNEGKRLTMDLLLGMVVADGYITYTEMYVIEFIADLFEYTPNQLNKIFKEATGRSKVKHGDLSSMEWWKSRERQSNNRKSNSHDYSAPKANSEKLRALAILGLESTATKDEIRMAFRLLSKIHHPDRFHHLGEETIKNSTITYIRIKDAYEYLMSV